MILTDVKMDTHMFRVPKPVQLVKPLIVQDVLRLENVCLVSVLEIPSLILVPVPAKFVILTVTLVSVPRKINVMQDNVHLPMCTKPATKHALHAMQVVNQVNVLPKEQVEELENATKINVLLQKGTNPIIHVKPVLVAVIFAKQMERQNAILVNASLDTEERVILLAKPAMSQTVVTVKLIKLNVQPVNQNSRELVIQVAMLVKPIATIVTLEEIINVMMESVLLVMQ